MQSSFSFFVSLLLLGLACTVVRSQPLTGTPYKIPGIIQAENFDQGGEGVAYHDVEPENLGAAYRLAEGVDIGNCFDAGQGYSIGWTRAGEWLQYTVSVATAGTYEVNVRYASNGCGGALHFELDGTPVTGIVTVNTTGGWQTWQTLTMTADLPAVSNAKLRLVLDGLGSTGSVANLNWMEFVIPSAKDEVPVSPYVKQIEYSGATFFDGFDFFTAPDPTHGYVRYVDRNTATNEWLARVTPSGQVMMTVDNSSIASSPGRKSVRIHSKQRFNGGLFILDLEHMPTGCGTWPAWWTNGPNWPSGGEIDILEGVHTQSSTVSVLHTSQGCSMYGADSNLITGSWIVRNCYVNAPGQGANQGCGINGHVGSFGGALNAAKGGVSVMLWNSNGIRVWFFQRGSIPADITAQQPNPDRWGKPYARFDFGAECPSWHFSNHVIIFNIAMCGDWAGGTFWSSCPGLGSCASYVQNNPRAFSEAYWLINSLRVYQPRA